MRLVSICTISLLLAFQATGALAAERSSVAAVNGNIVLTVNGKGVQLTSSGMDLDPVLSPNGEIVTFTRKIAQASSGACDLAVPEQRELWAIQADKSNPRRLLAGRDAPEPKDALCDFASKQFTADGRKVLFETPAWATSGALHEFDLTTGSERYVMPSNGFRILVGCTMHEYRDHLVVNQHRYFVFGGSFDWYWLFSPDGRKELGPVGEDLGPLEEACEMHLN